ncbi:hypothetical protein [Actinacidiphila acididurans]|uniref:DUF8017 domain-containing protein n=1 Tax=Actinacidiphila acididurans TaxID=2784346 RepID=A0ABS2U1U7_9ACTN|nr:hypothetical protein [Actinacidiphila acididurans]MBM9509583.1 hypothetical protein [Actinacidiphila acididurans]
MWPDQHGGQQHPQGAPPQQPQDQPQQPYAQPNPYAQPGYPQQPPQSAAPQYQQPPSPYGTQNPYAQPPGYGYPPQQPAGYPTPQPWGPPQAGGPDGPRPPRDRRNLTIGIAVTAAVAVIGAVVVGAVALTGGDKKNDAKDASPSPGTPLASTATAAAPTATPSPSDTGAAVTAGSGDSPRGVPGALDVKPVIPGWKVVKRTERNVAFDVPPNWTVDDEGTEIGFEDKSGNPAVAMGAPAFYKRNECTAGSQSADGAGAGTKGANGAKSVRNAAEVAAESWAYWGFQQNGKGTFSKALDSKAFHNAHGITGWQAMATATNVPHANKCVTDGAAYTVAWIDPTVLDPSKRLVVWVLYCERGVTDQVPAATIRKIESTIRLMKAK